MLISGERVPDRVLGQGSRGERHSSQTFSAASFVSHGHGQVPWLDRSIFRG